MKKILLTLCVGVLPTYGMYTSVDDLTHPPFLESSSQQQLTSQEVATVRNLRAVLSNRIMSLRAELQHLQTFEAELETAQSDVQRYAIIADLKRVLYKES